MKHQVLLLTPREFLDPVVTHISYVNVSGAIDRNASRVVELAVA